MARKRKADQSATSNDTTKKICGGLNFGLRWHEEGVALKAGLRPLIVLVSEVVKPTDKVAGFDIDFTVIGTKSGKTFATGAKDWKWLYDCVPDRLKQLHAEGYRVCFFTNQAGIEKNKVDPRTLKTKVEDIIAQLGIPVFVYVSTGESHVRKPSRVMWDYFVENSNKGTKVNLTESIYVGDAAGRAKEWAPGKPKDFSCSDRMFAINVNTKFATPEEFFLKEDPAPFQLGSFDAEKFLAKSNPAKADQYHSKSQEMVLMVGFPASGKSTFSRRHFQSQGYVSVNRDTLSTAAKCIKAAEAALAAGKSVVVDNTNPSKSARADYIQLAKSAGVPCRCFHLLTPLDLAHHLNMMRQNQTEGKMRRVPDVGYNVFKKNFEKPDTVEGFTEIITIEFVPKFDTEKDEALFKQWTG